MHGRTTAAFQRDRKALAGRKPRTLITGLVIALLSSTPVAADYLSDLEAEAEASAAVPSADSAGSVPQRSGAIGSSRSAEADGRRVFERALKAERPNTYIFYSRLPEQYKVQVADYYAASGEKMAKTVNLILDLYFQKKQAGDKRRLSTGLPEKTDRTPTDNKDDLK